jgi:hypothetical protein
LIGWEKGLSEAIIQAVSFFSSILFCCPVKSKSEKYLNPPHPVNIAINYKRW